MLSAVQRLLELQPVAANVSEDGLSSSYVMVLNHFWNERFEAAADHSSLLLSELEDHPGVFKLYRAWIEAMAELEDIDGLNQLEQHLLVLGRLEPESRQTFMALRGVIHLHLDQAPAARLMLRAVRGRDQDSYCLEFEQMCARRGFEGARENALIYSQVPIHDWFQWNSLIGDLSLLGATEDVNDVTRYVHRMFPGSPTLDLTNMHRAFDSGYWPGALSSAQKLHESFPDHGDFGFYAAYSAFKNGDLEKSLNFIRGLGERANVTDPDVLLLSGEILAMKALKSESESVALQAIQKLEQAAKIYRRQGKPVDHALNLIQSLEKQAMSLPRQESEPMPLRAPRSWMIMLNPSQYANLATSGDQDISLLNRPMGKEAMPGDIVLFMTKSSHVAKHPATSSQELRIVAVYRVVTQPYRHPQNRWHNALELVDRPDSPIPVDAKTVVSDWSVRGKKYSLPRGHHARFGVYELDESALDIVVNAVKRRSEGVSHDTERRGSGLSKKDSV